MLNLLVENSLAGSIRDLRDRISEALRNLNIDCGRFAVILSGGEGYRLSKNLSVQFDDSCAPHGADQSSSSKAGANVPNVPNRDVPNVPDTDEPDVPNNSSSDAATRQDWILGELAAGRRVGTPDVEGQFGCDPKTAKRDFGALKAKGLIEFVGPSRTGCYRLKQQPNRPD
jgi:hypothetical protein